MAANELVSGISVKSLICFLSDLAPTGFHAVERNRQAVITTIAKVTGGETLVHQIE